MHSICLIMLHCGPVRSNRVHTLLIQLMKGLQIRIVDLYSINLTMYISLVSFQEQANVLLGNRYNNIFYPIDNPSVQLVL